MSHLVPPWSTCVYSSADLQDPDREVAELRNALLYSDSVPWVSGGLFGSELLAVAYRAGISPADAVATACDAGLLDSLWAGWFPEHRDEGLKIQKSLSTLGVESLRRSSSGRSSDGGAHERVKKYETVLSEIRKAGLDTIVSPVFRRGMFSATKDTPPGWTDEDERNDWHYPEPPPTISVANWTNCEYGYLPCLWKSKTRACWCEWCRRGELGDEGFGNRILQRMHSPKH